MNPTKNTLRTAGWVLIGLGVLESFLLVYAIYAGGSFSGGAFLYCIIGIFLLRKDKTAYKISQFLFTFMLLFIPAACVLFSIMAIQIFTATDIPLTWQLINVYTLMLVVYVTVVGYLVMLLHHPNTREAMSLDKYESDISTLFIPKKRVVILSAIMLMLGGLIMGPHLLDNPYKTITSELSNNIKVSNQVGEVEAFELLGSNVNNWNVYSVWNVSGTKGQGIFNVVLNPERALEITGENERDKQNDCAPNKALNKDAQIARAC